MTALAIALVLASAAIHATWNLWAKQLGHPARDTTVVWALTAISSVCFAPFAAWMLATGSWRLDSVAILFMAVNAVMHVVYFVLLLRGYRRGDFSVVYPAARGTGPLFASAGAIVLLSEPLTPATVVGVLLVGAGVVVLSWGGEREVRVRAGLLYGLAIGVTIAIYTLWDGWAVKQARIPPLLYVYGGEVARMLLFAPVAVRDRVGLATLWRSHRARVVGIALMGPVGYALALLAYRDGPVSHLAPMREISILFGALLGGQVLGEAQRGRRLLAAAAFVAGVTVLALG